MRTWFRRFMLGAFVALSLVLVGVLHITALAQDVPSQIGPVTPDPASCVVEPRTAAELVALFAGATPWVSVPATTATITIGTPAEEAAAAQVTALIHQAIACLNAGDFGRFFALLTDDAIVTVFPWVAEAMPNEEVAAEMLVPTPASPELQQTILGIGSISLLPDGSYSAVLVQLDPNAGDQPSALILYAVEEDGVWLIDNAIDFDAAE